MIQENNCVFFVDIYWRYIGGPHSKEKPSGFFSHSSERDPKKPAEIIILAFKKEILYRSYRYNKKFFIIIGENNQSYPILDEKNFFKDFPIKKLV